MRCFVVDEYSFTRACLLNVYVFVFTKWHLPIFFMHAVLPTLLAANFKRMGTTSNGTRSSFINEKKEKKSIQNLAYHKNKRQHKSNKQYFCPLAVFFLSDRCICRKCSKATPLHQSISVLRTFICCVL